MNVQITVREGVLQGHFTPQGPTNPRLDPYYWATASSLYLEGAGKSTPGQRICDW